MIVRVWGARGSLSAPGPATVGYGGNTSCVELELADGTTLILDAGTGIRELGQRLLQRDHGEVHICLTHLHLDHVEGLGFFAPLWRAGWKLQFWGPPSTTATLQERVSRYLSPPLFPIGLSEAPAEAVFEDVPRKPWRVGSAVVEAQMVEHPVWIGKVDTVTSDQNGIFYPLVKRGTYVEQGMKIGYVTDYFGNTIFEAHAPASGVILYICGVPSMKKGDTVANVGEIARELPKLP